LETLFFDRANISLDALNRRCEGTLNTALGIVFTEVGDDYVKAEMPVNEHTIQPLGMLNGGASMALIETLGSMAANLAVDRTRWVCFGLDINGNHIRPAFKGQKVTGIAKPLHIGSTTQVWEVRIEDEQQKLVCIGRITMAVRPLPKNP
jgi:1,4-dihydroxy-2-naphthoyl-CoA hydrolase